MSLVNAQSDCDSLLEEECPRKRREHSSGNECFQIQSALRNQKSLKVGNKYFVNFYDQNIHEERANDTLPADKSSYDRSNKIL